MTMTFDSTGSSTGASFSATNTAGDVMFAFLSVSSLSATVGMTYNGVAMPPFASSVDSTFFKIWGFFLIAPATGTHTLAPTTSAGSIVDVHFVTYVSTNQSVQPDASSTTAATSGTSLTANVTTIANNCWSVMYVLADAGNLAAGSGSTLRGSILGTAFGVFDSNGAITPAGSHGMSATFSNGASCSIIASIAPVAAGVISHSLSSTGAGA